MSTRAFSWTLFDYEEHMPAIMRIIEELNGEGHSEIKFLAFQEEVCPDTGRPHLQGYAIFHKKMRYVQAARLLPGNGHCENRKGTHEEMLEYVTKDSTRKEGGQRIVAGVEPRPGTRSDLVSIKARLDQGAKEAEIADEFFGQWVRYHKAFVRYRGIKLPNRNFPTFTQVYWGPPGTGKTRAAFDEAGPDAYWLPKPNGSRVFWDGYEGEEHVVIDEFFGWMPRDLMCRICDRYPFRVETKGGSVPFVAKKIWITSNSPPCEWWTRIGLGPMVRRLTQPLGSSVKVTGEGHREPEHPGLEAEISIVD